jgi:Leucine-rich repeat (LRR) protein
MKTKFTSLFVLILSLAFCLQNISAQVNKTDSLALVDLYDSTNGNHWTLNRNWLQAPVKTWIGISVSRDGTRVTSIELDANNMEGTIPASIGNLTAMEEIDLSYNKLSGIIPISIGNFKAATSINFSENKLTGTIPVQISNLKSLQVCNLGGNLLTGTIPSQLAEISNSLSFLYLFHNHLTGTIPSSFDKLTNLYAIDLSGNELSGTIPSFITNFTKLQTLNLSNNKFTGTIPSDIGKLKGLFTLYLYENNLTGSIPSSIGDIGGLIEFDLSHNKLTGSIPSSIGSIPNEDYSSFRKFFLNDNQLTGAIPFSLGNLAALHFLILSNNKLTGSLPPSLCKLKALTNLSVTNNRLTGEIPSAFTNLQKLIVIQLDSNRFSGLFPMYNFYKLPQLKTININNNYFEFDNNNAPSGTINNRITGNFSINNFTFNGLEFIAAYLPKINYAPQRIISVHVNQQTLSVSAGGILSNNVYNWFMVGHSVPVTIAADSTFKPSENGNYYVVVTNKIATDLKLHSDTISFTKTSLSANQPKFSIYPNPVSNSLTINGLRSIAGNNLITITRMDGKVMMKFITKANVANSYNVNKLLPGSYILNVINGDKTYSLYFLKQ